MADTLLTLANPPGFQCYDCRGCAQCCRGSLAIAVTSEECARITAQGWEQDPALSGHALFVGSGESRTLAHRDDGACVFLDDDGRCRIHARFGEAAKPLTCRLYPFMLLPWGTEARVDIRFDCPAVAENDGRPLSAHRGALKALLPQVAPSGAYARPVPLYYGRVLLSRSHLARITQTFDLLLVKDELDITRRVLCAVNIAAALRTPRLGGLDGRELDDLLRAVTGKVVAAMHSDPLERVPPAVTTAALFRQLVSAYARADRIGERTRPLMRLTTGLRMLHGRGAVPPLRPDLPGICFAELDASVGIPDGDAADAIARYFRMRLSSFGFFGPAFYRRPYLEGLTALWLTYPVILWFARAFARGAGRTVLERSDVERAIGIVDHQHGRTPLLNLPSERFRQRTLGERSTLRALAVWYGT